MNSSESRQSTLMDLLQERAIFIKRYGIEEKHGGRLVGAEYDVESLKRLDHKIRRAIRQEQSIDQLCRAWVALTYGMMFSYERRAFHHPLSDKVWERLRRVEMPYYEWGDLYDRMLYYYRLYRFKKPEGFFDYGPLARVARQACHESAEPWYIAELLKITPDTALRFIIKRE